MDEVNSDIISGLFLMLLAVIFGWQLYQATMFHLASMFPRAILFLIILCAIGLIIKGIKKPDMKVIFDMKYLLRPLLVVVMSLIWMLTIVSLGFGLSSMIFIFLVSIIAEMKYNFKSILTSGLTSLLLVGVFYWIFANILLLRLPEGILF